MMFINETEGSTICVCLSLIYFLLAMAILKGNYLKANLYCACFGLYLHLDLLIWNEEGVA